eukprot:TRINITY_DN400_c0_g5_i1.p1 TRINITY_DN400_c0_g5~~TRINITY_DN400_c0_g5_i1.p1  ORF type:complete len:655 (-),score=140.60 TRINITY_DN400_c0_g5_i1:645-2609(-)
MDDVTADASSSETLKTFIRCWLRADFLEAQGKLASLAQSLLRPSHDGLPKIKKSSFISSCVSHCACHMGEFSLAPMLIEQSLKQDPTCLLGHCIKLQLSFPPASPAALGSKELSDALRCAEIEERNIAQGRITGLEQVLFTRAVLACVYMYDPSLFEMCRNHLDTALSEAETDPNVSEAYLHFLYGCFHLERMKLYEAEKEFQTAMGMAPYFIVGRVRLAQTLRLIGQKAHALRVLQDLEKDPRYLATKYHSIVLMERGSLYFETGDTKSALRNLDHSIGIVRRADALALRGSIFKGIGEFQKAKQDFSEAIELDPKHPIALSALEEGFPTFTEYTQYVEDPHAARFDEIFSAWKNGFARNSRELCIKRLHSESDLNIISHLHGWIALCDADCGFFEEAKAAIKNCIDLNPSSLYAAVARLEIDSELSTDNVPSHETFSKAESLVNDLVKKKGPQPDDPMVCALISMVYSKRHTLLIDAFYHIEAALRRSPGCHRFLLHRGYVQSAMMEGMKALQDFSDAISSNGKNPLAYLLMARMYQKMRHLKNVVEKTKVGIEVGLAEGCGPFMLSQFHFVRALAHLESSSQAYAQRDLVESIRLYATSTACSTLAGMDSLRMEESVAYLRQALALDPKNGKAKRQLKILEIKNGSLFHEK